MQVGYAVDSLKSQLATSFTTSNNSRADCGDCVQAGYAIVDAKDAPSTLKKI